MSVSLMTYVSHFLPQHWVTSEQLKSCMIVGIPVTTQYGNQDAYTILKLNQSCSTANLVEFFQAPYVKPLNLAIPGR
jgi:hypothetical protein